MVAIGTKGTLDATHNDMSRTASKIENKKCSPMTELHFETQIAGKLLFPGLLFRPVSFGGSLDFCHALRTDFPLLDRL